jgi:hypothetical protein
LKHTRCLFFTFCSQNQHKRGSYLTACADQGYSRDAIARFRVGGRVRVEIKNSQGATSTFASGRTVRIGSRVAQ